MQFTIHRTLSKHLMLVLLPRQTQIHECCCLALECGVSRRITVGRQPPSIALGQPRLVGERKGAPPAYFA